MIGIPSTYFGSSLSDLAAKAREIANRPVPSNGSTYALQDDRDDALDILKNGQEGLSAARALIQGISTDRLVPGQSHGEIGQRVMKLSEQFSKLPNQELRGQLHHTLGLRLATYVIHLSPGNTEARRGLVDALLLELRRASGDKILPEDLISPLVEAGRPLSGDLSKRDRKRLGL